ncbi:ABC transporter ATP-binding protein [Propionivibrio sp.]|uniref:ABC transporter ATP-binding protein n=1 Tax=Propionivibrio sp. TaxID=2212460 RepID=UPI0039E6F307
MSSDDIAISVRNLGKTYRLFGHPGDRIMQFLSLGMKKYHNKFTALHDVSFDIKKGETVGIIGRNGSGKSTLLQLICGILKPTTGSVKVNGRISALLELGAGFNPEFTGRENVYFQGAVMGISKGEMDVRFDEIAAFADIGEFVDQPVRTYSSGMFVRLAFAVAISVEPDILVVDEALAVGDARFQARCFERIAAIRGGGGTILLVTHALEQVAHYCDRAMMLHAGGLVADDAPDSTLSRYLAMCAMPGYTTIPDVPSGRDSGTELCRHPAYNSAETRWGDGAASIENIRIVQDGRENPTYLSPGSTVELKITVTSHNDLGGVIFGMTIKSLTGAIVLSVNSQDLSAGQLYTLRAKEHIEIAFYFNPFLDEGGYLLSLGVVSKTDAGILPHDRRYDVITLSIARPCDADGRTDFAPRFILRDAS